MAIEHQKLVSLLKAIAPLSLAQSWDNVGLVIDAAPPNKQIKRVLLTIDFDLSILKEALTKNVDFIVAYHPPIFSGLKRLSINSSTSAGVSKAIGAGVSIYSPHTALDSAVDGINDWIADGLLSHCSGTKEVIGPSPESEFAGAGRLLRFNEKISLPIICDALKENLELPYLRIASRRSPKPFIRSLALCRGAGASVFSGVLADCYITGEMRHHDVLQKVRAGAAVILSEHSRTERGYLAVLAKRLHRDSEGEIEVILSDVDDDPLSLYSG